MPNYNNDYDSDELFLERISRRLLRFYPHKTNVLDYDDVLQTARIELWKCEREGLRETLDAHMFRAAVYFRARNVLNLQNARREVYRVFSTEDSSFDLLSTYGCETDFETKHDVEALLKRLTDDEREVVRLRYFDDTPAVIIAKRLGVSAQTVHKRLHSALGKMASDSPLSTAAARELHEGKYRKARTQRVTKRETMLRATDDLSDLSQLERSVVELYRKGLSLSDISKTLDLSRKSVRDARRRAASRLERRLAPRRKRRETPRGVSRRRLEREHND